MLYLVAHSFLNSQSKNSNFFLLPELQEMQLKKLWSSGNENGFDDTLHSVTIHMTQISSLQK